MYDIKKKQYIVKLSSGRIVNYFVDDRQGLMYSVISKRNIWSDPVPAIKDCTGRAALEIDGNDRIHVLYQTRQGNIYYAVNTNNSWINHPVLNAKKPGIYDKNLELCLTGEDIHFFYTLQHNDNIILGHQAIVKKSQLTSPEVIDYVTSCDIPYSVHHDQQGNVYVYYASSDGRYKQLGYKILSRSTGKWSEFKPVTSYKGDHENPIARVDYSDNIHFIYTRRAGNGFELVYRSRPGTQSLWGLEKVISVSSETFPTASLICINEEVILFWIRENGIFYSKLPANTLPSVVKTEKYSFSDLRLISCVVYKTNLVGELSRFKVNEVPGIFMNGFRLAFIGEHLTQDFNSFTPDELRGMIVEGLKMLTNQVNYLKENQQKLESNYYAMMNTLQVMQRDITKSVLKLDMLDKEIRSMKNSYQQIEQSQPIEQSMVDNNEALKEPRLVQEDILPFETLTAKEILLNDEPVMSKEPALIAESSIKNNESPTEVEQSQEARNQELTS